MTRYTYSNQEAFDKVAVALVAQGERSLHERGLGCAYGGEGGMRCAAGHLLPKRTPKEVLTFIGSWPRLILSFPQYENLVDAALAIDLQAAHDTDLQRGLTLWTTAMQNIAVNYKLSTDKLESSLREAGL